MRKGRGEIVKLSTLFEKYTKTLKAPQGIVTDCFREVVFELIKLEIPKVNLTYSVHTKMLSVRVSGPLKSEIQLRKKEILNHMKGRIGTESAPKDIV
jgi:hypothetical protein